MGITANSIQKNAILVFFICFLLSLSGRVAGLGESITLTGVMSTGCNDGELVLEGSYSGFLINTNYTFLARASINGAIYENSSTNFLMLFNSGNLVFAIEDVGATATWPMLANEPLSYTITVKLGATTVAQSSVLIDACNTGKIISSPTSSSSDANSTATMPPDERLNWQYGDTNVGILYRSSSSTIDLYLYEENTYIAGFMSVEDLAPYKDNPPSSNQLLRQSGRVSAYILTTGQIQFNFGPDPEGKIWVLLMDDFDTINRNASYRIEPNQ